MGGVARKMPVTTVGRLISPSGHFSGLVECSSLVRCRVGKAKQTGRRSPRGRDTALWRGAGLPRGAVGFGLFGVVLDEGGGEEGRDEAAASMSERVALEVASASGAVWRGIGSFGLMEVRGPEHLGLGGSDVEAVAWAAASDRDREDNGNLDDPADLHPHALGVDSQRPVGPDRAIQVGRQPSSISWHSRVESFSCAPAR